MVAAAKRTSNTREPRHMQTLESERRGFYIGKTLNAHKHNTKMLAKASHFLQGFLEGISLLIVLEQRNRRYVIH